MRTIYQEEVRLQIHLSAMVAAAEPALTVRYVAAHINNHAMVHGAAALALSGDQHICQAAIRHVDAVFPQVRLLAERIRKGVSPRSTNTCESWASVKPMRAAVPAIGINVGQSYIKGVSIGPPDRVLYRMRLPTARGSHTRGEQVRKSTIGAAEYLLQNAPNSRAIGLCTGGIVHRGHILEGSGITAGLAKQDTLALQSLSQELEQRYGLPVITAQDARSKAYYHSATNCLRRGLIVDLGTSLGGAYIDADGRIPDLLSQVGRLVYDLSESATTRADGEGRGLLSQHLSGQGLQRLRGSPSVRPNEALESRAESGAVRRRVQDVLAILRVYYDIESVMVSGGLIETDLVATATRRDDLGLKILRSAEPTFDAAIGIAMAASGVARTSMGEM